MTRPSQFWTALEAVPGATAVAAQWQEWLGAEYARLQPLLRPRPERALSYPRLDRPAAPDPSYEIVDHGAGRYVGVCPESGARLALGAADLVLYEPDWPKLLRWLAAALELEPTPPAAAGTAATWWVGQLRLQAGSAAPVLLHVPWDTVPWLAAVHQLLAVLRGPWLLLTPTRRHWLPAGEVLLRQHHVGLLALSEAFVLDAAGAWTGTDAVDAVRQSCQTMWLPPPGPEAVRPRFPTPADVGWGDLELRFRDRQTVVVRLAGQQQRLLFVDLGMVDRRDGLPDQQWQMLYTFAEGGGRLPRSVPNRRKALQKTYERLAAALKTYFGLPGEPLQVADDRRSWRTAFRIGLGS